MSTDLLVGIDEAGRGTWAGPLVAAAVALSPRSSIPRLTDSKLLTAKIRYELFKQIQQEAVSIGIGWVTPKYIDEYGLTKATSLAMQTAADALSCSFNLAVIDGNIQYIAGDKYQCVIKADQTFPAVSAASIVAKVARDTYMDAIAQIYPGYGFDKHFGYGTKAHVEALNELGVSPIHRLSYKPVQNIYVNQTRQTG